MENNGALFRTCVDCANLRFRVDEIIGKS